tara:strand:- start:388 stop:861 length:474 start_codon:yes stop_codon:yes gene_type:complete
MDKKIFLSVTGLRVDDDSNSPILLLASDDDSRIMPIWVGSIEAVNIAYAKDNVITSRPLTHELLINIIESLDAKVSELCIDDVVDNTFHAHLIIETSNGNISVPCRPSDGVSIAIRSDAPISIYKDIFDTISVEIIENDDLDEFDKFIDKVNPSDFA